MPLQTLVSNLRRLDSELARYVGHLREGGDPTHIADALEAARQQIVAMAGELSETASSLSGIDGVIADAINNMLMSVQTASDRLRDGAVSDAAVREVSTQLRSTVENGRTSVSRIRQTIGRIR